MLTVDDRKRFTAFVQLLITIDRKANQARDKNGRYASSKQQPSKEKPLNKIKARKKCEPYLFINKSNKRINVYCVIAKEPDRRLTIITDA